MVHSILIIGGTGAQGVAVIRSLSAAGSYKITALTRSASSPAALSIASLPNVSLLEGDAHNEPTLRSALRGQDATYVNTNGFAIGEKAEIYWGIRTYELAREAKVRHFVWGSVPYGLKKGGYDPKYRCGHLDGKGKVADFISAQATEQMAWTILTSGPYIEMLTENLAPSVDESGTFVFPAPLGDGAVPLIYLEDHGAYARWIFDNPARSTGMNLSISTEHVAWKELAATFSAVTGKPAKYAPLTFDEYFSSVFPYTPEAKVGHSSKSDDGTLMTYRENFTGFWNVWKASGGNHGIVTHDYALLDEILPTRVKSAGEWMRKVGYTGERAPLLKDIVDRDSKTKN